MLRCRSIYIYIYIYMYMYMYMQKVMHAVISLWSTAGENSWRHTNQPMHAIMSWETKSKIYIYVCKLQLYLQTLMKKRPMHAIIQLNTRVRLAIYFFPFPSPDPSHSQLWDREPTKLRLWEKPSPEILVGGWRQRAGGPLDISHIWYIIYVWYTGI